MRAARTRPAVTVALALGAALAVAAQPIQAEQAAAEPGASADDRLTLSLPEGLSLHRPNYALPLTWSEDADDEGDAEFKFQFSLKYQILQTPFYAAYTQEAYFRWLDEDDSRPFREINFMPELWYGFRPGRLEPDWLGLDIGIEHQSNGESQPESRSWNRAYVRPYFQRGPWQASLKVWSRFGAPDEPSSPSNPDGDDNPDIVDYYGRHELRLDYTFADGERLSLLTRYSLSEGRGALRLDYAWPTGGNGYWYAQLFTGYGESLETFRENRTRIGIGFALMP